MSENLTKKGDSPEFLTLMNSFSQEEMKSFQRFVESPYFNTDKKIIVLLSYIKDSFFRKKSKQYDKKMRKKIYKLLFPNDKEVGTTLTPQQQGRVNKKFSRLSECGKLFLLNESLKRESPQRFKLLYEQLIDRKLENYFEKFQRRHRKELESKKETNIDYYLKKYELELSKSNYQFKNAINTIGKSDNLRAVTEALDVYYIPNRIRIQLACISLMGLTQRSYDIEIIDPILNLANLSHYRDVPIVSIYRTACEMEMNRLKGADTEKTPKSHLNYYRKESEKYFDILVELLHQHENVLANIRIPFWKTHTQIAFITLILVR